MCTSNLVECVNLKYFYHNKKMTKNDSLWYNVTEALANKDRDLKI